MVDRLPRVRDAAIAASRPWALEWNAAGVKTSPPSAWNGEPNIRCRFYFCNDPHLFVLEAERVDNHSDQDSKRPVASSAEGAL